MRFSLNTLYKVWGILYNIRQNTFKCTKSNEVTDMAEDRRIKKTQRAIINATVKLLDTVPINKLTVGEICAKADVSRSTFYLHYYDATDVIDQVHNNIIASITNVLDKFDYATILVNPECCRTTSIPTSAAGSRGCSRTRYCTKTPIATATGRCSNTPSVF